MAILFAPASRSAEIARAVKGGTLRKLASKLYTRDLTSTPVRTSTALNGGNGTRQRAAAERAQRSFPFHPASRLAYILKIVEDVCVSKQNHSFAALVRVAQDQQGYFTTRQALAAGYADNTHPYHVRAGNWEHVRRGIYRMAHFQPPEDGEMMAWLLWSRGRDEKPVAVLSHQTALSLFELGDFNPAKIHLSVPKSFRRNSLVPQGVVLHRASLAPGEITALRGLRVCRPLRALCDLAEASPELAADLQPIVAEARRRGLMTGPELAAWQARPDARRFSTPAPA